MTDAPLGLGALEPRDITLRRGRGQEMHGTRNSRLVLAAPFRAAPAALGAAGAAVASTPHGSADVATCQNRLPKPPPPNGNAYVSYGGDVPSGRTHGPLEQREAEGSNGCNGKSYGVLREQRAPTRSGSVWQSRKLLGALRAARLASDVARLVDLHGDDFGAEHVAAALDALVHVVSVHGTQVRLDTVSTSTATGVPTSYKEVQSVRRRQPGGAAVAFPSGSEPRPESQLETTQPPALASAEAQSVARQLLEISIRLLAQPRRWGISCLLALLVQPRRLGLDPEPSWVLPVLKQLIAAAPSLFPNQLVLLLETLAARDMWEFAPASGTVGRRLALRLGQQLEAALPHLQVHLAARALGATARLAPRGFGPFLEKEAQRDAGGYAVQWAVRRAREAATARTDAGMAGPHRSYDGHGHDRGNGDPAVIAWAGRYMDRAFAEAYMSYIRTALSRGAVSGVDAARFLEAIARFAEWPGVAALRNLDQRAAARRGAPEHDAVGLRDQATAKRAQPVANGGPATPGSVLDGDATSAAAAFAGDYLHGDSLPPSPSTPVGLDMAAHRRPEYDLVRPVRRAVLLPRESPPPPLPAPPPAARAPGPGLAGFSNGLPTSAFSPPQSSSSATTATAASPSDRAGKPRAWPTHAANSTRPPPPTPTPPPPSVADPHTDTLLDLITLLPAPSASRDLTAPHAAAAVTVQYDSIPDSDLELCCSAFWALVRMGVRPSPPWPGTLARVWWALCVVRWVPAPAWRVEVMGVIRGAASALTPDQVCMVLGGFGMWRQSPGRSWLDGLLAQAQPKLPAFHATSCTALAFACARVGHRPRASFLMPYLQQCSSQLPYMDGRNLVNLLWALHRLELHHALTAEWRARFLTSCRGLMRLTDSLQPPPRAQQQLLQLQLRPRLPLQSLGVGGTPIVANGGATAALRGWHGSVRGGGGTVAAAAAARYELRAGLVAAGARPPAAHAPFTPSQLSLLLLLVAKCELAPGPVWRGEYWRACETALPYMPPMALAMVLNGVWRLRVSPPLPWMRAFFAASGAAMSATPPVLLAQYAKLLLLTPMRPPGSWVALFRSHMDANVAAMPRRQLDLCMRMIRAVSWRRRRTAPPGWLLRCARTKEEAADRWRRTQAWRARRQGPGWRRGVLVQYCPGSLQPHRNYEATRTQR
ncbi:hypothetical protein VOLCADRAFT_92967 [Volvox carteri f. nagariensis]|uniref:Uncharacterized protein n=1 Tax=Volvox carteri f. nagariensis TaxID=3068 RepID=D8U0Z6_VOLCA|nr:uncharacterized protein VOLCADRAFT_92967 [Volvox carteri f. nagariensis]EFJ46545.1 hypothetical protein VOLCADRAFT_92967 [Volvox carteri f. nagariensis]|eukprot:XP_002952402.1 hypothetical protein VOLCADRAFT_92967 [Volvox carteri f. nagariensis]